MTIRERRGGFQVLVYAGLDPVTGRQRYISRQVNGSRREAERVKARLMTEVADGRHVGTRVHTLGEMVDIWLDWRAGDGKDISPRTLDDYRRLIETKIAPGIGKPGCARSTRAPWMPSTSSCATTATHARCQANATTGPRFRHGWVPREA